MSDYLLRAPSNIRLLFVMVTALRTQQMGFTRCGSNLSIKPAGGVLHFPLVGRGPPFSQVAIFHLAYARRIRVCLSPSYKVEARRGPAVMELFGGWVIILVLGPSQAQESRLALHPGSINPIWILMGSASSNSYTPWSLKCS